MTSTCIFGLSTEVDDVTSDVWSRDNLVAEGRTLSTFLIRSTEPGKEINSLSLARNEDKVSIFGMCLLRSMAFCATQAGCIGNNRI